MIEYGNWTRYLEEMDSLTGLSRIPVFYGAWRVGGGYALAFMGIAAFCAILTGIFGNFIAASHLLGAMAKEGMLPGWFKVKGRHDSIAMRLYF